MKLIPLSSKDLKLAALASLAPRRPVSLAAARVQRKVVGMKAFIRIALVMVCLAGWIIAVTLFIEAVR